MIVKLLTSYKPRARVAYLGNEEHLGRGEREAAKREWMGLDG
jgi:hypothetical protein